MRQYRYIFLLIFVLALLQSCNKDESLLVVNVSKEFKVKLLEHLSPSNDKFELIFTTIDAQSCLNAEILYSNNFTSNEIRINLNGVEEPTDCIPGLGPLSETVPLNLQLGEIGLEINLKNEVFNAGILYLTDDTYRINMISDHGIDYSREPVRRIPGNMVWGYIGSESLSSLPDFQAILNNLVSNGLLNTAELNQGDYGHFSLDKNQNISGISVPGPVIAHTQFIYSIKSSVDELKAMIATLKSEDPNLVVHMITSDGIIIN